VIDNNPDPMFAEFEDVSKVEKYEISEESYSKRDDTFRKFKEEKQKVDPSFMKTTQTKISDDF
jgi:tubulin-folding cofactor B